MLTTPAPGTSSDRGLQSYIFSPGEIPAAMDDLRPFLELSAKESKGMISASGLERMLLESEAVAFATIREHEIEAVLVLTIVEYDTYKAARVIACAGKSLIEASKFLDALGSWALTMGAIELEAWCRPAVENLLLKLRWEHKVSIVTYDLRRKLQ